MARYGLFVLKVPLNPNQPTNRKGAGVMEEYYLKDVLITLKTFMKHLRHGQWSGKVGEWSGKFHFLNWVGTGNLSGSLHCFLSTFFLSFSVPIPFTASLWMAVSLQWISVWSSSYHLPISGEICICRQLGIQFWTTHGGCRENHENGKCHHRSCPLQLYPLVTGYCNCPFPERFCIASVGFWTVVCVEW